MRPHFSKPRLVLHLRRWMSFTPHTHLLTRRTICLVPISCQRRWMSTVANAATTCGSDDFIDLGIHNGDDVMDGTAHVGQVEEIGELLGIRREIVVDDEQKFSRLHIPLTQSSDSGLLVRPNSRSAAPTDTSLVNVDDENVYVQARATETLNKEERKEESSLPYDDERFADMLLEMEVEGAIDEAWQDSNKAHMEDVVELVEVMRSMKVRDISAIDVSAKTGNFDYMIFGTCEGPRHIHLAAWAVQEADSLKRISKIRRKQTDHTWEVVPVGRIVVNLMQESLRDELSLERKWTVTKSMDPLSAANAPISEGRQVKAHGLWTLTLNLQDLEDFEVDYCKDVLMRQL